jgi:protein O-GlcNAc transferase
MASTSAVTYPDYLAALSLHKAGKVDDAITKYRMVLETFPQFADAWHMAGVAEHQRQSATAAIDCIQRAIALNPNDPIYRNNLGVVLLSIGQSKGALDAFDQAVAINPAYAEATSNAGKAFELLGEWKDALDRFRQALALNPTNVTYVLAVGRHLLRVGQLEDAIALYRNALAFAPHNADLHNALGNALVHVRQSDKAAAAYEQAVRIDGTFPEAQFNLANAYCEQGRTSEAMNAMVSACALRPDKMAWRARAQLLSPTVFSDGTAIDAWQRDFSRILDELPEVLRGLGARDLLASGICPPFPLAFQGRTCRALKEKLAAAVRPLLPRCHLTRNTGRPRIGFVITSGHEALFLRCTGGVVDGLSAKDFDIVVFAPGSAHRMLRDRLHRQSLQLVSLGEDVTAAAEQIASLRCDVVYYWEVGTDAMNYLLPFMRPAPIQCTSWGTPVTSGVTEIDYYLSSHWIDCDSDDTGYTERVYRLKSLPTYQRRIDFPATVSRNDFGFSADEHLYLFPQMPLKLHPDTDPLLRRILELDPNATIVLKEGRSSATVQQLDSRLKTSLGFHHRRIRWIPWQSRDNYYRLVGIADVVIDATHYSAGSSCYDMFSGNLPIITLPGTMNVSRYTQACYNAMELDHLVAGNQEEYVAQAIAIATSASDRQTVRASLIERTPALFEDAQVVGCHADFFKMAASEARRTSFA